MTITHRLSGGLANADPALSLGGPISNAVVTDEPMGRIGVNDFINGHVRYRCFYVHTTVALQNMKLWLETDTGSLSSQVAFAWSSKGINTYEQSQPNQLTPAPGMVFAIALGPLNSLNGGNFPANGFRAFWLRYQVNPQSDRIDSETFSIGTDGITPPPGTGIAASSGLSFVQATSFFTAVRRVTGSASGLCVVLGSGIGAVTASAGTAAGTSTVTSFATLIRTAAGSAVGVGATAGATATNRFGAGTAGGIGAAVANSSIIRTTAGSATGAGATTGAARIIYSIAGTAAGVGATAAAATNAAWIPSIEPSHIAWFDVFDPALYNTTTKVWTARFGGGRTATADLDGPVKITNGFTGAKNALQFAGLVNNGLTMANAGAAELMTVIVFKITQVNAADPTIWTRAQLGIGISGLLTFSFGGARSQHLSNPADYYNAIPNGGMFVTRHSAASRIIRFNGTEVANSVVAATGTPPIASDTFRIVPFETRDFTIQIAAVGIFNANGWSTALAERCEGFAAHQGLGISSADLPAGHPFKAAPPGQPPATSTAVGTATGLGTTAGTARVIRAAAGSASGSGVAVGAGATGSSSILLFDALKFALPATITAPSGNNNQDRYITGGPFNAGPFSDVAMWRWWGLGIVTTGANTPLSAASYVDMNFETITGPDGNPTRAFFCALKLDSPNTGVEQARVTDYQSPGLPGVGGRVEPKYYQRMWVKFDVNTLARGIRVGASNFYQIFWEPKCEPDFRFRCQLRYNGTKLTWQCHDDILSNANEIHSGINSTVNVVLAATNSSSGWHRFEVYMDRNNGVWRVAVDGSNIINLNFGSAGKSVIWGATGNIQNFPMFMQCYSTVAMAGMAGANDGPVKTWFGNLILRDSPPADAWQAGGW